MQALDRDPDHSSDEVRFLLPRLREELALAVQLIDQAATDDFQPDKYKDEVRERVMNLIQQKIDGEDITAAPAEEPQAQIIDLMEALKASVAGDDSKSGGGRKPAKRGAKKSAAKTSKKRKTGSWYSGWFRWLSL